jgi:hypothetical protein
MIKIQSSGIKILHACSFTTSIQFYNNYIKRLYEEYETKLIPTLDINEADYIVVCNGLDQKSGLSTNKIPIRKVILYQYEPPSTCDTFDDWGNIEWLEKAGVKVFDIRNNRSIVHPYFDVKAQAWRDCVLNDYKRDRLCFITSLWNKTQGHRLRNELVDYLHKDDFKYHLFGGMEYTMIDKTIDMFKQYVGPVDNKYNVLSRYKYSIAIENTNENNWFSEKIWDNIISECLTFYWGCPNLEKFLPDCFIRLPLPDYRQCTFIMEKAIDNKEWEKRLPAIKRAKKKVLNELSLIPTMEKLINEIRNN